MKNSELVHAWAQQRKTCGQNGNGSLSFVCASLRSYSTEIARFIETKVIYTKHRYSITTSGKHQIHIPNAISNHENYRISREMREIPRTWPEACPIIILDILEQLEKNLGTLIKSKSSQVYLAEIEQNFMDLRSLSVYKPKKLKLSKNQKKLYNFATACDGLAMDKEHIRTILKSIGIDIEAKLLKEKELQKKKEAKEIALQQEKVIKWRSGNFIGSLYKLPVMLRLSKDGLNVETSHGASVPLAEAKELFKLYQSNKILAGTKISNYSVRSLDISNQVIIIGCHSIPLIEAINLFEVKN
jgi:hypothetical protein